MATKIFCDGCDAEITVNDDAARKNLKIEAYTFGAVYSDPDRLGQFEVEGIDICGLCMQDLKDKCQPRNWPRFAKDGPLT